jgi:hypothetical protein
MQSFNLIPYDETSQKVTLDNFKILKLIGQGAFGKVYLV